MLADASAILCLRFIVVHVMRLHHACLRCHLCAASPVVLVLGAKIAVMSEAPATVARITTAPAEYSQPVLVGAAPVITRTTLADQGITTYRYVYGSACSGGGPSQSCAFACKEIS